VDTALHRIVVVGGGAGGLELATRLGNELGRRGKAHVTLIDKARTHLWKPLLHEIAAGSMDEDMHAIDYLAQAYWHGFVYRSGAMEGIDQARRLVQVAPFVDGGKVVTSRQDIGYDTLIIAIGSLTNDFGTRRQGARHRARARKTGRNVLRLFRCRRRDECLREQLQVAIIGAGATGTELAAELHKTTRQLVAYGLDRIDPDMDIKIHLIEAAPRILPQLPERLAEAAAKLLEGLKVRVHTGAPVAEVMAGGVRLANGQLIPAELVVWAAGVKAPDVLADIAALETNRLNQLVVRGTLQTTRDDAIFAIGDCAACPWPGHDHPVPPRAQAAHQQASHLARQLPRRLAGEPLSEWRYRDCGSLVSLGHYSTVGSLMGKLIGGNLFIEGVFAGLMYKSLYKMHQLALHGLTKVSLDTVARLITRRTEPHVKLH
jgi:NADH dehydrogenase